MNKWNHLRSTLPWEWLRYMPENHLVYKLEGDVREINIFRLAPTLLALGQLIQESNHELFPDGQQIAINVKPFREGSFTVGLTLFASSNLQQLIDFLTPQSLEQLESLLTSLGLISGGMYGVVRAIKFLGGKPKAVEEVGPNQFRYTSQGDESITVDGKVHTLLSNSSITQNVFNVFGQPMQDEPSVSGVKTYIEGREQETATVVTRDEVPVFREFVSPSTGDVESIKDTIHTGVFLNPKRGAFGNDPRDWSFYRGEEVITATIKDARFLNDTAAGIIRLNESDLLTVDLLERQRVRGTKVLKPIYEIIRVTDYKRGAQQILLAPE